MNGYHTPFSPVTTETVSPLNYIYTVRVIDHTRTNGYREELVLGHDHKLDETTFRILMDEPCLCMFYNWQWVLGFSRMPIHYGMAVLRPAQAHPQYRYHVDLLDGTRENGRHTEQVDGYAHQVTQAALMLMVNDARLQVWYNFRWVLNFAREPLDYAEIRSVLG